MVSIGSEIVGIKPRPGACIVYRHYPIESVWKEELITQKDTRSIAADTSQLGQKNDICVRGPGYPVQAQT